MKIQKFEADGFIVNDQFKNVLSNIKNDTEYVFIISTREINGDIVVDSNNIKPFAEKFSKFIKKIRKKNKKTIFLLLNSWYKQFEHIFELKEINEVIYIDLFLYDTHKKLLIEKQSKIVEKYQYNTDRNRFLFLTNKPIALHRIGLVYKLYQRDLLKNSDYSFMIHNKFMLDKCEETMGLFNNQKFNIRKFHKKVKNSLDLSFNDKELQKAHTGHYTGIPYDESLFQKCNFQLISETHFDMTVWITEKTWISIANKRPFIIAAYPGFLKKLKEMGFKTFEDYLAVPNYDSIKDDMLRLDAIVSNVDYWINNIYKYEDEIVRDTDHNFKKFLEIAQKNQKIIEDLKNKHNLLDFNNIINGYENYEDQIWFKKSK